MYESAQASRGRAEISQDNPPTRRTVRHRAVNATEHARKREKEGYGVIPPERIGTTTADGKAALLQEDGLTWTANTVVKTHAVQRGRKKKQSENGPSWRWMTVVFFDSGCLCRKSCTVTWENLQQWRK